METRVLTTRGRLYISLVALLTALFFLPGVPATAADAGADLTNESTGLGIQPDFGFGHVFVGPELVLSGEAIDDIGVRQVRLGIKDRNQGLWLQDDRATWGSFNMTPAVLSNPNGRSTSWSLDVELSGGDFALAARAFDGAGNHEDVVPYRHFSVGPDDTAPIIDADFEFGHEFPSSGVALSGSASDDQGVDRILVGIKDRNQGLWLQDDRATWGSFNMMPAVLSNPNWLSTFWSLDVALSTGDYALAARAFDGAGNDGDVVPYRHFSVGPDVTAPIVDADFAAGTEFSDHMILTGTAFDDTGVTVMHVAIRDRVTKLWLQSDKVSWGSSYFPFVPSMAGTGTPDVTWSLEVDLPQGIYSLSVSAWDEVRNRGEVNPWRAFSVVPVDPPDWKILVLVYENTDFEFTENGVDKHFVATMTADELARAEAVSTAFFESDVPALSSGLQTPQVTVRYPTRALDNLEASCGYWPAPLAVEPDADPAFDSVVVIWDGSGVDVLSGQPLTIAGCRGLAGYRGTMATHLTIPVRWVLTNDRNVFKHEWGHSILFYHQAAGTTPAPPVNNHMGGSLIYVHCGTGEAYVWQDETVSHPIPNSLYNNESGFTHDYYSGIAAVPDNVNHCLGITPQAWAMGGPVTKP